MALYAFHDVILKVERHGQESVEDLPRLLEELSWVPCGVREPSLRLSISLHPNGLSVPPAAREVFRADGFSGRESGDDFYVTDGSSLLHLQPARGEGTAFIAPSFFTKPPLLQNNFWAFGLLKLLRPLGFYSLHAAGIVSKEGVGLLVIGPSGSGKSTLAIGLARQGWHYLSDDAVLLRAPAEAVEALALRKHFYIDADAAVPSGDVSLGEESCEKSPTVPELGGRGSRRAALDQESAALGSPSRMFSQLQEAPDNTGRTRRRVRLEEVYPAQYIARCLPQVLLFSRIVPEAQSALFRLDRVHALRQLLAGSGPQLFDRGTMPHHLEVLKRLIQQSTAYELRVGRDLYRDSMTLVRLLNEAEGAERWPAS
jgi:hypothetical protein